MFTRKKYLYVAYYDFYFKSIDWEIIEYCGKNNFMHIKKALIDVLKEKIDKERNIEIMIISWQKVEV